MKWCQISYFLLRSWFKEAQYFRSLHELSLIFHVPHCQEILKALKILPVNAFSKEMFGSSLNLFWHLVWSPWYEKLKCWFLSEFQSLGTVPERAEQWKFPWRGVFIVCDKTAKGDIFSRIYSIVSSSALGSPVLQSCSVSGGSTSNSLN